MISTFTVLSSLANIAAAKLALKLITGLSGVSTFGGAGAGNFLASVFDNLAMRADVKRVPNYTGSPIVGLSSFVGIIFLAGKGGIFA